MLDLSLPSLKHAVGALRDAVVAEGDARLAKWAGWIDDPAYAPSAENFARYLALRHHDIRPLQRELMRHGLSSLGRVEAKVTAELDAVLAALVAMEGGPLAPVLPEEAFFAGQSRIAQRAEALFGPLGRKAVHLLVTLPTEAAEDATFCLRLAERGVGAVRINCAHDGPEVWRAMIAHARAASDRTGQRMAVLMDLGGPKIRTGDHRLPKKVKRLFAGDTLALTLPGQLGHAPRDMAAMECSLPEALHVVLPGQRVHLDDGKLACRVIDTDDWGVTLHIDAAPAEKGYKLKAEKGVNFPDCALDIPALTEADEAALRFAVHHADGVEFSFVQHVSDIERLQAVIAEERPEGWRDFGLVLKIETQRAVANLPDMLVSAAGRQPTAVMIARGDLAVEIGFARLAEMQEELLWLCEAAQVPVIWATQVLESLLKTGVPTRGEMTDAAMGARAECVMLNKGPYLLDGIDALNALFARMVGHMNKKTPQLRPLTSW